MPRLHVHRSESGAALVTALAAILTEPPGDPFTPDVVAVPTQGIERWLAQQLSHHLGAASPELADGVCANVEFPHPNDVLDGAVTAVSAEHSAAVESWRPGRTVWQLVDHLGTILEGDDDRFAILRHHLTVGQELPTGRRYALARRIAGLFDDYAGARPDLLRAWAAGSDDVPDDLSWQPPLWRELRDRLGPNPAELLEDALSGIRAEPDRIRLPDRLSVYGPSRIDASRLSVLAALAAHRDVHLWLNHASPRAWEELSGLPAPHDLSRAGETAQPRNPLLSSLSRDVRELQRRLAVAAPEHSDSHHSAVRTSGPTTLLAALQESLLADEPPAQRHPLDSADRSIQIHACHGRSRQVEVLRDVVLGLLADDPSLEPRDILVMCPDVDAFAPLVTAAFATEPADLLRVRLADRAPRESNAVLAAVSALLDLVAGRVGAPQLLALAGMPPVRRRFGFDDDDLEQIRLWTVEASAHWGLDEMHRGAWSLSHLRDGTWRAALDRLLTGVALGESDELYADVLPLAGVDSGDIDLAGRFAELVDRVASAVALLGRELPIAEWLDQVEQIALSLLDVPRDEAWQLAQLRAEIGEIRHAATGSVRTLQLADVRTMLDQQLSGRPTRSSFRTGGITVCTLLPMRSVPHRVICLLGLDDEAFPRRNRPDGDSLLARDPRLGERDPRSEDRQLYLDAITAATEHLVITYRGAHERTGATLPPAVPVGELLDALDGLARPADPVREHVVIRHPLQPADSRNFTPGALRRPASLSFDVGALAGARSRGGPQSLRPAFLPTALTESDPTEVLELDALQAFWAHPARGFLRQRLELLGRYGDDAPSESIPLEIDNLESWSLGDRMLDARRRDVPPSVILEMERSRGALPPGNLAVPFLAKNGKQVDATLRAARPLLAPDGVEIAPESVDIDVALSRDRLLGTVRGLYGAALVNVTVSRVAAKHQLRAWINLLALTLARPDVAWTAVIVGKGGPQSISLATLGPVPPDTARTHLDRLTGLRRLGLTVPLPLPLKASAAFAARRRRGDSVEDGTAAASREWLSDFDFRREDADVDHVRVWGPTAPLDDLLTWQSPIPLPGDADTDPGAGDFDRLSQLVWAPLLEHLSEQRA